MTGKRDCDRCLTTYRFLLPKFKQNDRKTGLRLLFSLKGFGHIPGLNKMTGKRDCDQILRSIRYMQFRTRLNKMTGKRDCDLELSSNSTHSSSSSLNKMTGKRDCDDNYHFSSFFHFLFKQNDRKTGLRHRS